MRTAIATFYPPSESRMKFMKQLGIDDIIIWGNTFDIKNDEGHIHRVDMNKLSFEFLVHLKTRVEDAGLNLYAIENVPVHFYDKIMLGKPGREMQMEHMQNTLVAMGRAGIKTFGYNWMPSGVWRTSNTARLRGGAMGTGFNQKLVANAPLTHGRDYSENEFWEYYHYWAENILPVAASEGVKLAIHPNDAPIEKIGGIPFLFRNKENFQRALDLVPSDNHGLTYCIGCWSEMGYDQPEMIRYWGAQNKVFYVHFQAVNGCVPEFKESFVDCADYDAYEVMQALSDIRFDGVMIPGHVPTIEGDTEWRTRESAQFTPYSHAMGGHRARAYTIGYLKGLIHAVQKNKTK